MVRVKVMSRALTARSPIDIKGNSAFLETLLLFVKWSQGRLDLETTLEGIASYVGAEAASLSRWESSRSTVRVAGVFDPSKGTLVPRLSRSFARSIYGNYIDSIKPGSALLLSEALDDAKIEDPELERWMFKRDIVEIACICLSAENGTRDILEFHFTRPVPRHWYEQQHTISTMLFDVFQGRQRGLMMQALLRNAGTNRRNDFDAENRPLLGPENPVGLTRCEWRVCALIANGLSRDGIARELNVKPGTVRTHLRNIYAKTGYERFHELALRLVSVSEQQSLGLFDQGQAA